MTVTTTGLTKAAGVAAAAAGAIFIGVQINHPQLNAHLRSPTTDVRRPRTAPRSLMAALALAGITGMYLRQVRRNGVLGLVGYLVFSRRLPRDHVHHRSSPPSSLPTVAGTEPGLRQGRHRRWPPAAAP